MGAGRPPAGRTVADRLRDRLGALRKALIELLEAERPGSLRILRERPAIEAEIWGVEAQLAAELGKSKLARAYTADAVRWQAEARKGQDLDTAARVHELERRLGVTSDLGQRLEHLK